MVHNLVMVPSWSPRGLRGGTKNVDVVVVDGGMEDFSFGSGQDGVIEGITLTEYPVQCLLRFAGGCGNRLDGGVEIDNGDTNVSAEVNAVVDDTRLLCLICRQALRFQTMDLLLRFIGIMTNK